MTESLTSRVRTGAVWSAVSALVMRGGTFAMGILVARLVSPEQVGVFVVALTVQMVLISASELGIATAIARNPGSVERLGPTATTLSIASSALLTVLMIVTSPSLAAALGSPSAAIEIQVMSLTVLLAGLSSVPNGMLVREFQQQRRFLGEMTGFLVGAAMILALSSYQATGLAWARVIGQACGAAVIILLAPRRFRPGFDRGEARSLLRFGLPLVGASALGFTTTNADYVVVGRWGGPAALGPYSLAFNVSSWPLTLLTSVVNSVALPAFARAQGDAARMTSQLRSAMSLTCAVGFPISAMCAALAGPLIASVYGEAWLAAVPALIALTALGALRVPLDLMGSLVVASGMTRRYLVIQAAQLLVSIPALVIGVRAGGVVGAAIAQVVVTAIVVLPGYALVVGRTMAIDLAPVRSAAYGPAAASLLAGGSAFVASHAMSGTWGPLILGGVTGGAVYSACMWPTLRRLVLLQRTKEAIA